MTTTPSPAVRVAACARRSGNHSVTRPGGARILSRSPRAGLAAGEGTGDRPDRGDPAGRTAAARLAEAWPGQTYSYEGPARQAMPQAWAQCDGLVCFLAVGATVRLIAPLLDSKWTDPAVVCVDESARYAVAVVGGHAAGANALAARVARVFGAAAVITTATDAVSLPGLDMLGWQTEGAVGTVSRALLDGELVRLEADETWPLPPLPATVGDVGEYRIRITDRVVAAGPRRCSCGPRR